ncbi:MAG: NAD(P)H-hydrate dehydratase [Candidatus Didemnitutus sp.]|nr:NAD(P)H-hydrate dehydratase [Candidatus Didemnitutus sp.]
MQRAGRAIARALLDDAREVGGLPDDMRLLVLAGKGHNGGDALLAAAMLLDDFPLAAADVVLVFGAQSLRPLARRALEVLRRTAAARARELDAFTLKREFASYDACLDGVFGFQFHPPLDEATGELLAWVNTHPRIRLRAAVDLPSGLGENARAKTVFRADFTYATGIVKLPVVAPANADVVGRVRYLDLGFFAATCGSDARTRQEREPQTSGVGAPRPHDETPQRVLLRSLVRPLGGLRPAQTDKRTFGHLLVVGGSMNYPGAVLMTVQAALRSGVGLLTACVPEALVAEYAAKLPEAMWCGYAPGPHGGLTSAAADLIREKAARATALVIGPGLGAAPETLAAIETVFRTTESTLPVLLDADALRPELVRATVGRRVVATPHAGEWQRIREGWTDGVLVLKGSPTRVQCAAVTYFSFFGGPVLARGGSGDLLAGLIGGRMAQAPDDLLLAAAQGVVWHGLAADLLARDKGQVAVQTTQLLDYLQPALHCTDHEDP